MTDNLRAEVMEWQARTTDLETTNERLREERDSARATVHDLTTEVARLEQVIHDLGQQVDRLRLHIQQGVEL